MEIRHEQLKNPAWHSLRTRQADLGHVQGSAARYRADISIFAALNDRASLEVMVPLAAPKDIVVLLSPIGEEVQAGEAFEQVGEIKVHQMVCETPVIGDLSPAGTDLGPRHSEQMLALARATDPGPFAASTGRMGRYVGAFDSGELIAMAGERFRLPGWTEISGVCTLEKARGRGLAKQLMVNLMQSIFAAGDKAFLHVREGSRSEHAATHAYEQLGFVHHQDLMGQVFRRLD